MYFYKEKVETELNIPAQIYISKSQGENCHYPLHWHNNLEFDLVLYGTIIGRVNGEMRVASTGDIFFVNCRDLHETDAEDRNKMSAVTILLSHQLLKEYCADIDSYRFDFSEDEKLKKQIKELILCCADLYQKKEPYYELDLSITLRKLCAVLLKECKKERTDQKNSDYGTESNTDIRNAIEYIEKNYRDNITLGNISEFIGMSPNYFSRFFKKTTGATFYGYLTNIRLYYAYKELMNNNDTITEIAMNCGFPNVKAFIEAFKKEYRDTPVKYRNKLQKDNN